MTISVTYHQATQNKSSVSSYGINVGINYPKANDYVIVIASFQNNGTATAKDSGNRTFDILQSINTGGVSTYMFGLPISTTQSSYGITVTFSSAPQSQVYEVIYLHSSSGTIRTVQGDGIDNSGYSTYALSVPTQVAPAVRIHAFSNNGASSPVDTSDTNIALDSTYTSGKGGSTNVGITTGYQSIATSGGYTAMAYNTGTSNYATVVYEDFTDTVPDSTPPSNVTNLNASYVGYNEIDLAWTNPTDSDFSHAVIYRDGTLLDVSSNGIFYDTGVSAGMTYGYKVTAVDNSSNESSGTFLNVTTPSPDTTAPSIPTGLTAVAGDNQVSLSWNANTEPDLSGYNIYRSTDDISYSILNQSIVTTNTYTDTTALNGIMYYFKITALDTNVNESSPTNYVTATPVATVVQDTTPPSEVTNLRESHTDTGVTLQWSNPADSDFDHSNVYRDNVLLGTSAGGLYIDDYASPSTTYSYKITTVDTNGNESTGSTIAVTTSAPSDTIAPSEVTNLSETHTTSLITLTWVNPTDSDFAYVQVFRDSVLVGDNITNQTYSDINLTPSTTYVYNVVTVDTIGNKSAGSTISITTDAVQTSTAPSVTIVDVTHYTISDEQGFDSTRITFTFDQDVVEYTVNVNGVSWDSGTVADSGTTSSMTVASMATKTVAQMSVMKISDMVSALVVGTEIIAIIDWTELYQEGQNRVNIYGKNSNGDWTVYQG